MGSRFYVETLGCPKNEVDSEKLIGTLLAQGLTPTNDDTQADVVVVNTCAFIEEARKESIDTIMALSDRRKSGARLVVTGCMAERYGDELRANLPEADQIAGFGVAIQTGVADGATPVTLGKKPSLSVASPAVPSFDLLNLPRPKSRAPWAYVKIAEGCDRNCGFCAIPSFRGPQRSRDVESILREVDELQAKEIVLVAKISPATAKIAQVNLAPVPSCRWCVPLAPKCRALGSCICIQATSTTISLPPSSIVGSHTSTYRSSTCQSHTYAVCDVGVTAKDS